MEETLVEEALAVEGRHCLLEVSEVPEVMRCVLLVYCRCRR